MKIIEMVSHKIVVKNLYKNLKSRCLENLILINKNFIELCIFCFSFLYIYRQIFFNNKLIDTGIIICYVLIVSLNIKRIAFFLIQNILICIFFIASVLISFLAFGKLQESLTFAIKLILFLSLFVYDNDSKFAAMKSMVSGFMFALTTIIILNWTGLITGETISNVNWIKDSYGFSNPNIGPIFLVSASFGSILFSQSLSAVIASFGILLAIFFNFFSRAEILINFFIIIKILIKVPRHYLNIFFKFICITYLLYGIFFYFVYFGIFLKFNPSLEAINSMLSNRLYLIYSLQFVVSSNGPIFMSNLGDGIFYDFIFPLGLPILFIFIARVVNIFFNSDDYDIKFIILIFIIFGLFEGVINKVTPLGIFCLYIIFINKSKTINSDIRIMKFVSLFGMVVIIYLWSLPVYNSKIQLFDSKDLIYLKGVILNSTECNKLYVEPTSKNIDGNFDTISITANNKELASICVNSVIKLMEDDFDDIEGSLAHPVYESSIVELKKENFLRYSLVFFILMGIFCLLCLKDIAVLRRWGNGTPNNKHYD